MKWNFEYGHASVCDLHISAIRQTKTNRVSVDRIALNGEELKPSNRFWRSFFTRFGISDNVFRYFEPDEVFERISEKASSDAFRFTIERDEHGKGKLLAVSGLNRPIISHGEIDAIATRYGATETTYHDGIVTTTHRLRNGDRPFEIGGDRFQHRFVMETPVDGFSHPKIYLSFLREVCSNGMVGYARAFRSDISLGKDIGHCIRRALESYDNGDGYAALRQRFESAQSSWASVFECMTLVKTLNKLSGDAETHRQRMRDFHRMTGNLNRIYGLANMDALTQKRQRILPGRCRVYDLINFASELATHHVNEMDQRHLQAYIGTLISDEYDMEGTAQEATEFSDFFVESTSN